MTVPATAVDLRFGVGVGWLSRGEAPPAEAARAAEAAGFDIVTAADHVGAVSPFVTLAAAAAVTERVRLRTYVLDYGLWNPGLLARDVATLDAISGGRVDLGIGLGHMRHEHDAVGLPFPPYAQRLEELSRFVAEVRGWLAGDGVSPPPVQRPVPVLLASTSARGLELACREADLVALAAALRDPVRGGGPAMLRVCSAEEFDERAALVRARRAELGRPQAPLDVLVQKVVLDRDPLEAAERDAAEATAEAAAGPDAPATSAEELLGAPGLLYGRTAEDAAAELVRRSERWGVGSWCVHQSSAGTMARVIEALRR